MKLFVCVFLILMVLEEYNCVPIGEYYHSNPLESIWRTNCGFGYPDYYYPQYRPYYYGNSADSKEIDASSKFLDKLLNKPSENSSAKPNISTYPSAKPLDNTSIKPSDKPLIPAPMGDLPSEFTADIDPPYSPLDEHL